MFRLSERAGETVNRGGVGKRTETAVRQSIITFWQVVHQYRRCMYWYTCFRHDNSDSFIDRGVEIQDMVNMDQFRMYLSPNLTKTVDPIGVKRSFISSFKARDVVSVKVSFTGNGVKLPLTAICKSSNPKKWTTVEWVHGTNAACLFICS